MAAGDAAIAAARTIGDGDLEAVANAALEAAKTAMAALKADLAGKTEDAGYGDAIERVVALGSAQAAWAAVAVWATAVAAAWADFHKLLNLNLRFPRIRPAHRSVRERTARSTLARGSLPKFRPLSDQSIEEPKLTRLTRRLDIEIGMRKSPGWADPGIWVRVERPCLRRSGFGVAIEIIGRSVPKDDRR